MNNKQKIESMRQTDRFIASAFNIGRANGSSYEEMLEVLVLSLAENRETLEKMIIDRMMREPTTGVVWVRREQQQ